MNRTSLSKTLVKTPFFPCLVRDTIDAVDGVRPGQANGPVAGGESRW